MSSHLLSSEDLAFLASTGLRTQNCPDLFTVLEDGRLVWTIKGLQFVRAACALHRHPYPAQLATLADLYDLAFALSALAHRNEMANMQEPVGTMERQLAQVLAAPDVESLMRALESLSAARNVDNVFSLKPSSKKENRSSKAAE